jgi:hypothetical protein
MVAGLWYGTGAGGVNEAGFAAEKAHHRDAEKGEKRKIAG